MFEICSDLSKTGLKIYFFCQHSKKAKKWPNGQKKLFLANRFKKGQMATLLCQINSLKIEFDCSEMYRVCQGLLSS